MASKPRAYRKKKYHRRERIQASSDTGQHSVGRGTSPFQIFHCLRRRGRIQHLIALLKHAIQDLLKSHHNMGDLTLVHIKLTIL